MKIAAIVIGAFCVLFLLFDSTIHLMNIPPVVQAFARLGVPDSLALAIGVLELVCVILYVIPRTAILGAVLLTAYLGGAVAINLRADYPLYFPVIVGVLVWTALYLSDERVRALMPVRRP